MSTFYASYPASSGSMSGVSSLNGLEGDLTLTSNDNSVVITPSGLTIDLSATGGGNLTIDPVGSSPNAYGATASSLTLTLQPADGTHPGVVTALAQTIGGAKTFSTAPILSSLTASLPLQLDGSKNITAVALDLTSGTLVSGKGNLTDAGTDGITITGGTGAVIGSGTSIAQHVADTTHNGYLSSTDWNTFNGKQATISIGSLDAQAENANGLALVSNVLSAQSADATHPGMVNTTTQTFAGAKTFSTAPVLSSLTASTALVLDGSKNVASLAYTSAATNSTIASRDIYGNSYFTNVNGGSTATASSGQTVTMNAGNTQIQKITGTSTITFKLPDATTLINGNVYQFNNNSTGTATIQNASAGAVTTIPGGGFAELICTDNSTTAGVWDYHFLIPANSSWGTSALTIGGSVSASNLSGTNSGDVTLNAVGSSPNANGASLSTQSLTLQPFDSTHPGVVTASGGGTANFLRADGTWTNPVNNYNFLVNGAFDYWQAGTSATVTATGGGTPTNTYLYQADQWYVNNILGGGTIEGVITYSQTSSTLAGSRYALSAQITTAPTGTGIQNGLEVWQPLSKQASFPLVNQSASFSVQVKALGNVNQVGIQFFYSTTETKPTVAIGSEVLTTVNSSTFTQCVINGQALGNTWAGSGLIGVRIRPTAVSSGHLYDVNTGVVLEQAMLNLGSTAATFQRQYNDPAQELAACMYFYEVFGTGAIQPSPIATGAITTANTTGNAYIPLRVRKRANPSTSLNSNSNFTMAAGAAGATSITGSSDGGISNVDVAYLTLTFSATAAVGGATTLYMTNTAGRVIVDARI